MTVWEFDKLITNDRVSIYSTWQQRVIGGVVTRVDSEEIQIQWDDHKTMTILRHEVRIYHQFYDPIQVVRPNRSKRRI